MLITKSQGYVDEVEVERRRNYESMWQKKIYNLIWVFYWL